MMMPLAAIAVGQAYAGYYPPLIAQGQMNFDGNISWNVISNIPNFPQNGNLSETACSQKSCIAVGLNVAEVIPSIILQPVIVQRINDSKNSWNVVELKNLPESGKFQHAACSDNFCIALGEDTASHTSIVAMQNSTEPSYWKFVKLDLSPNENLESASCFQDFCLALGGDKKTHSSAGAPLILQSQGHSWQTSSIPNLPKAGVFLSASCNTTLCVAVGQDSSSQEHKTPILAQSADHGKSWKIVTLPEVPQNGVFYHASCSENRCIAAGAIGNDEHPLLAESNDGGQSWFVPNIDDLPDDDGFFTNTSCAEQFCIAVGGLGVEGNKPLIVQSHNGAQWKAISIPNLSINLRIFSAACFKDFCIASGGNPDTQVEEPAGLLQSFDRGKSWELMHIKNMPDNAFFYGSTVTR